MKEFIIVGGLETLAAMIDDENLYLRGQVLEVLLCATDCDTYDWFKPADGYSDKLLHSKLLDLGRNPAFLRKLLNNRTGSYPGGSFRSLQLIAFTLSWIRALYTADQKLQLSVVALEELRQWSYPAGSAPVSTAAVESKEEPEVDPEVQLAKTLLDDFGGELNAPSGAGADGNTNSILVTSIHDQSLAEVHTTGPSSTTISSVAAVPTVVPVVATVTAAELKNQGNELFKVGKFEESVSCYQAALDLLALSLADKTVQEPSLYSNIATAWWKVVQDCLLQDPVLELHLSLVPPIGTSIAENNTVYDKLVRALEACAGACRAALTEQPAHSKAAYRLASVLLLRQAPEAALEVVDRCVTAIRAPKGSAGSAAAASAGDDLPSEGTTNGVEMLLQVKRRCTASLLLAERDARKAGAATAGAGMKEADLGLSGKTGEVLRALLVQHQIELDLPVQQRTLEVPVTSVAAAAAEAAPVVKKTVHAGASGEPAGEEAKPKKKKKLVTGTSSVARKLQEIDDNMLDALMKRSSIKS